MALIPYMFDLERPFRMMEKQFMRPDEFSGCPSHCKPLENVLRPRENIIRPLEQLSAVMNQLGINELGKITADDKKFEVNVDVQHFMPEEIDVKVIDGHVVVEGKHEEKRDEHGYVSRQFVRRYALPKGCLPDMVESKLSSDGVLTVSAPKVLAMPSIGERIVPIIHTGPVHKQNGSPGLASEEVMK